MGCLLRMEGICVSAERKSPFNARRKAFICGKKGWSGSLADISSITFCASSKRPFDMRYPASGFAVAEESLRSGERFIIFPDDGGHANDVSFDSLTCRVNIKRAL